MAARNARLLFNEFAPMLLFLPNLLFSKFHPVNKYGDILLQLFSFKLAGCKLLLRFT
jgi:hypothetical protein